MSAKNNPDSVPRKFDSCEGERHMILVDQPFGEEMSDQKEQGYKKYIVQHSSRLTLKFHENLAMQKHSVVQCHCIFLRLNSLIAVFSLQGN